MCFSRLLALAALLATAAPADAALRVVTSFGPVQSVVAGVMDGVGAPEVLVKGGASPHAYAMRPSEARLLEFAQIVFWVGPEYETFLVRPLANLAGRARTVALSRLPGAMKLDARDGGIWEEDGHGHGHSHAKKAGDGHLFLDPRNMMLLAQAAANELARLDPPNAQRYADNATKTVAMLDALDRELAGTLRPLAGKPFIVFHDALQYLEARYGLTPAGSITVSPERKPGARRIQQLRERIRRAGAICVFAEPQFEPSLVRTVVEATDARTGTLDYVGTGVPPGPDFYPTVMRGLAISLAACLSRP